MRKKMKAKTITTNDPINVIGELLFRYREVKELTQDQFGQNYDVSGPAIFKFEKGYVKPSFELWMRMASDMEIAERRAVFIWVQAKLPEEYRHHVDFMLATEPAEPTKGGKKEINYAMIDDPEKLMSAIEKDHKLPEGLRMLLLDQDTFSLFKPTGAEIQHLRDQYANVGKGNLDLFRQALMLLRNFKNTH